ncbi:MAG: aminoglycoside N(3)-acetyltransferase [Acidimicrobiia bacterium]
MAAADPIEVDELVRQLTALGVAGGDVVMVHASLRRLGPVVGGASTVIDALDRAVGPQGTIMMVPGAEDDWSWVNDRPEAERPALLADATPFDALVTPADETVGVLAEVMRTTIGTVVSDHPEARFAARGAHAPMLTSDVPWDDFYGIGSPLERLVTLGGKVLRIGADIDTVTLTHYAENLVPLAHKRRVRRCRRVMGPDGPRLTWVEAIDDNVGIADWPHGDYFAQICNDFLSTGMARVALVGRAQSELFDAAQFVTFAVEWMTRELA